MMPSDAPALHFSVPVVKAGIFTILWCGIPFIGCSESDRVVATVNGMPIHASELEPPTWVKEKEKQYTPDVPKQEMDIWIRETRRNRLNAKILEVLEKSEANKLNVTVDAAEVDRTMAAFREYVASIKPGLTMELYGRQANAKTEALNRLQETPDKADEIYAELLEPLGMDRSELNVSSDALPGVPFVGHSPETEVGWRQFHEEQLLRQKRLSVLFNIEFEISDIELDAKKATQEEKLSSGDDDPPLSLRYMTLGLIREQRINEARAAWLETAVAEADIRIVAPEFDGLSLQVEHP